MPVKSIILIVLSLACVPTLAATNEEKFREAYQAYQEHLAANETKKALTAARTAYQAGAKAFGDKSVNTANLASNYAALLNDTGELRKARKVLRGKLEILEARHGSDSAALVPMLVELGRSHIDAKSPKDALDYFDRAATAATTHENRAYAGQKNFDIAMALLDQGLFAPSERYMTRAHEVFTAQLEPYDVRRGLTSYQMAMWATSRAQYPKAIEYLNGALAAFTTDEETMSGLERTVRYRLVDAYERLGEREAATEHCLAVGARQEWSLPPSPLYGMEAVYPAEALDKGLSGEVRLSFTIDEKGYVADATVAESSEAAFDEAALEMIRQYRYAPRFVDGKPVATDGVQVTAVFDSAKQRSGPFKADFNLPALPGFQGPRPDDPAVCGDINDPTIAGRCQGFGNRK